MSGLRYNIGESEFRGNDNPRGSVRNIKTNGVITNVCGGLFSPRRNDFVATPATRGNFTPTAAFPRSQRRYRAHHDARSAPISRGGHQNFALSRALRQTKWEQLTDSPDPCNTLKARLSLASFLAVREDRKSNMKSVDRTAIEFKRRFSGLPGQDWIGHVDMLEIMRANKHQWTAREYYYGLQHTLAGKTWSTVFNLEQGLECSELTMYLPDWFECDMQELRQMIAGRCGYGISRVGTADQSDHSDCIFPGPIPDVFVTESLGEFQVCDPS